MRKIFVTKLLEMESIDDGIKITGANTIKIICIKTFDILTNLMNSNIANIAINVTKINKNGCPRKIEPKKIGKTTNADTIRVRNRLSFIYNFPYFLFLVL